MLFLVFDENKKNQIEAIEHNEFLLRPRLVDAGEFAGLYAIPARILQLSTYDHYDAVLDGIILQDTEPSVMWPPQEIEEE